MDFCVILPVKDEQLFIERCLNSLVGSCTSRRFAIYVVDDHSTDETMLLVRNFSKASPIPIILLHNKGKGVAAAYRTAIDACGTRYVVRFTAHLIASPETLDTLVNELERRSQVSVVTCRFISSRDQSIMARALSLALTSFLGGWGTPHHPLVETGFVRAIGPCSIIKRDVLRQIGGYPEGDDSVLSSLLERKGLKIYLTQRTHVQYTYKYADPLSHLARMFDYGHSRAIESISYPSLSQILYFAPSFLVSALAFDVLVHALHYGISLYLDVLMATYVCLVCANSLLTSANELEVLPLVILGIISTHISYGIGHLFGLTQGILCRLKFRVRTNK